MGFEKILVINVWLHYEVGIMIGLTRLWIENLSNLCSILPSHLHYHRGHTASRLLVNQRLHKGVVRIGHLKQLLLASQGCAEPEAHARALNRELGLEKRESLGQGG